ncbi:GAF domain-containing protein [Hymenobacter sp. YC55]|nr:GAF domain-containing protein [Hymenobacter sp. YC55]
MSMLSSAEGSAFHATLPPYQQLGNVEEQVFDELVLLAARLCKVPIAFISLLEDETVWFKHTTGWSGAERLPHNFTLCSVAVAQQTATIFPDLRQEPCLRINTQKIDALGLRFYAGMPLRSAQDQAVGVLAVLDQQPRQLLTTDQTLLEQFARLVESLLDLYRATAQQKCNAPAEDAQVYSTIVESIQWMQALAKRTTIGAEDGAPGLDNKPAIGQEAHELTHLIRHHLNRPQYFA